MAGRTTEIDGGWSIRWRAMIAWAVAPVGAEERSELRTEELDRDVACEPAVERPLHGPLTTGTQLGFEQISVAHHDLGTRCSRHGRQL